MRKVHFFSEIDNEFSVVAAETASCVDDDDEAMSEDARELQIRMRPNELS